MKEKHTKTEVIRKTNLKLSFTLVSDDSISEIKILS